MLFISNLVQAQYLDNRDHDQYYVRHSPPVNHRSVSGLTKSNNVQQQPTDDLPSSQSLFMMDFKRQAILIPEAAEKLSSEYTWSSFSLLMLPLISSIRTENTSNHTVIEKYIIDSNSPEYQQLLQKMVSVEKSRPPFFLTQANQAMSSSRSSSISKAESEQEHSSLLSEKESSQVHAAQLLKHSHKYLSQPPYESSNYHHHLISSKMPMDLEKKESSRYATVAEDKSHLFDERMYRSLNGTLSEEKVMMVRRLQGHLRASLEALLVQLNELTAVTEHEIKKLCNDENDGKEQASDVREKSHLSFNSKDQNQRGHHINVHYVTKYSS